MGIINSFPVKYKPFKRGRVVELVKRNGKTKKIILHKNVPKGCSTARRICIKCLVVPIHKLAKNFDSKICKQCS